MGMSKNVAAVFFCLPGIAAGAGCFCDCCNWAWCDNCQTGCCQGTLCQPPNCRTTPGPSPPPQPGWQPQGPGCCPQTNAEATSTTMVNCLEDWQLARRNAVKLEGSMRTSGPMLPRTARVTGR